MCLFSWFPFYYKRTDQGSENLLSNMRHTMFVNIYLKLAMEKKKKKTDPHLSVECNLFSAPSIHILMPKGEKLLCKSFWNILLFKTD